MGNGVGQRVGQRVGLFGSGLLTLSQAKRAVRVVVGFTLLFTGVALIVLPGPAVLVIPVALAILAGEFVWAKKLLAGLNALNNKKNKRKKG